MNESNTIHRGFHAGHLVLALVAGAAAGAGIALLTAPYSGADTRGRIRTMAHDTNATAQRVPDAVRRATEAAREAFASALELEDEPEVVTARPKRGVARNNHARA